MDMVEYISDQPNKPKKTVNSDILKYLYIKFVFHQYFLQNQSNGYNISH